MVIEPVSVPLVRGLKVTERVQVPPAGKTEPQLLVSAKSPETAMFVMVNGAVPVLLKITGCAVLAVPTTWVGKVKLVGDKPTPCTVPLPVSATVCGLSAALSERVIVPVRLPAARGVNVTLMVQAAPTVSVGGQLFVSAKSPVAAMLVIDSAVF